MTILAYIALWKRPEITRICFDGLVRLRAFAKKKGITLQVLCVGSEGSMKQLCKKYGFIYTHYKNEPLGEKKNHGLNVAMALPWWDYMLELGSDDLVRNELLVAYGDLMATKQPYICPTSIAFINSEDGETRTYTSDTVFGAGRLMHRDMLEAVCASYKVELKCTMVSTEKMMPRGSHIWVKKATAKSMKAAYQCEILEGPLYKLWDDEQQRRLDGFSDYAFHNSGYTCKKVATAIPMVIDIKSDVNLWRFNAMPGSMAGDVDEITEGLSGKEVKGIKKLIKSRIAAQ